MTAATCRLPLLVAIAISLGVPGCVSPFETSESARDEVVQLVELGTLSPPDRDVARVELPSRLRHASVGGEIIVSRLNGGLDVVFFGIWGIVGSTPSRTDTPRIQVLPSLLCGRSQFGSELAH